MNAVERILAYDDGQVNQHRDATWQKRRDDRLRGKPMPDNRLPEGTFTQDSPGGIANTVKNQSHDFGQAMRRMTNYQNSRGRPMPSTERRKMDQAKDALRDAYGEPNSDTSTTTNETTAIFQQSFNALPGGHNLDETGLDTGLDSPPEKTKPVKEINDPLIFAAIERLCADQD